MYTLAPAPVHGALSRQMVRRIPDVSNAYSFSKKNIIN
jgi:hypothetical protein